MYNNFIILYTRARAHVYADRAVRWLTVINHFLFNNGIKTSARVPCGFGKFKIHYDYRTIHYNIVIINKYSKMSVVGEYVRKIRIVFSRFFSPDGL